MYISIHYQCIFYVDVKKLIYTVDMCFFFKTWLFSNNLRYLTSQGIFSRDPPALDSLREVIHL
jgi:hypothetical protein